MKWIVWTACFVLVACGDTVSNDAGTMRDAAPRDASGRDSAADGGIQDADGGIQDAGDVDAAQVDAGERDAGERDVGDALDAEPASNPIPGAGPIEAVAADYEGEGFGFAEGPHWHRGELFFTDQYFGRPDLSAVYALTTEGGLRIVVQPSDGANGLAHSPSGALIACHQAGRRIAAIRDDSITTLHERYEGQRFNGLNDIIFRRDGAWFFTDPGYGNEGDAEMDVRGLYFVPAGAIDSSEPRRVWSGSLQQRPNGVVLSPDDSTLYLADTADGVVRAFDVASNGELTGERTFASVGGPDGMTVDVTGNVYIATNLGVEVFSPDGTRWGAFEVDGTTNVTFGDEDAQSLYITTRSTVYRTRLNVRGIEGR